MNNFKNGESETSKIKASSLSWHLTWGIALILILGYFSAVSSAISLETNGSSVGDEEEDGGKDGEGALVGGNRVKRSRDVQQLCGYRLLDALRSVCDRNFVGFTRRSDPSFLQNGDFQSGEDSIIFSTDSNLPWEILAGSSPSLLFGGSGGNSPSPAFVPGDSPTNTIASSGGMNGDGGSILDYLEMMQSAPSSWNNNGGGNGGRALGGASSGSKAFALKMLGEPPKTHQRFRRNIIDECCKKPCAIGQMLKYCAITNVGKRGL